MHLIEKSLFKYGLGHLMLEGYDIFITAEAYNDCDIFCPEWQHAFSYLRSLVAVIINLQQHVKNSSLLYHGCHINKMGKRCPAKDLPVSPVHFLLKLRDCFQKGAR